MMIMEDIFSILIDQIIFYTHNSYKDIYTRKESEDFAIP
jgi:hypothetical protein